MMKHYKTQFKFSLILGIIFLLLAVGQKAFGQCNFTEKKDDFDNTKIIETNLVRFNGALSSPTLAGGFVITEEVPTLKLSTAFYGPNSVIIQSGSRVQILLSNKEVLKLEALLTSDGDIGTQMTLISNFYKLTEQDIKTLTESVITKVRVEYYGFTRDFKMKKRASITFQDLAICTLKEIKSPN